MANRVVEAVSADRKVQRVLASWAARGWAIGVDDGEQQELARIAVAAVDQLQTWDEPDNPPRGVDKVLDERALRWVRDVSPRGNAVWICYVGEDELTDMVGPVTEVTDQEHEEAPRDKAWLDSSPWDWNPAACRGCGVLPGDAHQDRCPNRQPIGEPGEGKAAVRGPLVCQAKHPEDDRVTCQVHHHPASRHPWRHSNFDQAISWLEENPPDHGEQEAPEAPATVAITQEAVTGLVDLLHQAAVKFTRLNTAYKGSATKGANTLAAECEQASQLLQSVIDGKETKE